MKKKIIIITVLFVIASIFYLYKVKEDVKIPSNDLVANQEFVTEGYLVINSPGLEQNVWYLLYEEQGKPALFLPLIYEDKSGWEPGIRVKITGIKKENKIEATLVEKIKEEQNGIEPISIGGDKDEHGCFISAGYSFCEAKGKCMRIWEEGCGITNILARYEDVPEDEESCKALKGEWGLFGLSMTNKCNLPTSDANKNCYSNSECEGNCIATLSLEEENMIKEGKILEKNGKCSSFLNTYGCNAFVQEGKINNILCVD